MIEIIRIDQDATRTLGVLFINTRLICFTLEPPWKDNQRGISCIPVGRYPFFKYESKKYNRECLGLLAVEGRDYIAIHQGNIPIHTRGCILPGITIGEMGKQDSVLDSALALNKILLKLDDDSGLLTIKDKI